MCYWFIPGDSAYPLTERLLTPYSNPLTPAERKFNQVHKRLRVRVENCLGLLKGQWRRLKYMDVNTIKRGNMIIESSILLHNYAINHGLSYSSSETQGGEAQANVDIQGVNTDTTPAGHVKRNEIASMLWHVTTKFITSLYRSLMNLPLAIKIGSHDSWVGRPAYELIGLHQGRLGPA